MLKFLEINTLYSSTADYKVKSFVAYIIFSIVTCDLQQLRESLHVAQSQGGPQVHPGLVLVSEGSSFYQCRLQSASGNLDCLESERGVLNWTERDQDRDHSDMNSQLQGNQPG